MKPLFLLLLGLCGLASLTLPAQTNGYADTLRLEVGDRARVIFLAKERADFAAISRYDLNAMYAELLRELGEPTPTIYRELSHEEAGQYLAKPTRFWHKFSLNAFVGMGLAGPPDYVWYGGESVDFDPDRGYRVQGSTSFEFNSRPGVALGLSINRDFGLLEGAQGKFFVRSSLGYDLVRTQVRAREIGRGYRFVTDDGLGFFLFEDDLAAAYRIGDSLAQLMQFEHTTQRVGTDQLYLQVMPMRVFNNRRGEAVWEVGLGYRLCFDLGVRTLTTSREVLSQTMPESTNRISLSEVYTFSQGWSFTIGYRRVKLFVNRVTNGLNWYVQEDFQPLQTKTASLYTVGLRLGK